MFKSLIADLPRAGDFPERQFRIHALTKVIDGSLYDHLPHSFYTERNEAGEYIPVMKRRPSSRSNLCRVVVDDSVSLLFSEAHFPLISCKDERTAQLLNLLVKETMLNQTMMDAATRGSVGSVAIFLRVLRSRVFFDVLSTEYLTPEWRADALDRLAKVRERFKLKGSALRESGYQIVDEDLGAEFWFGRDWDEVAETWYEPLKVSDAVGWPDKDQFSVDSSKTTLHKLGFVPIVWVKNLPNGDEIDGGCTFKAAIDTMIEIDYLMSQGSRGLRYSSDPTLLIKDSSGEGGEIVKGGGNALKVDSTGDAKLLEISGSASQAMVAWIRMLRESALEACHGNRSSADKVSAAASGKAMEMMNQALIWLADKLRISYGEGALLSLLNMVVRVSQSTDLVIKGVKVGALSTDDLSLRWGRWYHSSASDRQADAQALTTLTSAGILSRESATKAVADEYDIENVGAERGLIEPRLL